MSSPERSVVIFSIDGSRVVGRGKSLHMNAEPAGAGSIVSRGRMMQTDFQLWLQQQNLDSASVAQQLNRAARVEKYYGNLDRQYTRDRLQSIIDDLLYTPEDEKKRRPNPSKINFEGNIRNNLSLFRYAIEQYRRFKDSDAELTPRNEFDDEEGQGGAGEEGRQRSGLERDMQAALRVDISQLEEGLQIIDGGAERTVESGSIPITARDVAGAIVVIDLKAGSVGRRGVAQVLSYMGDIAADEPNAQVRGILVATEFENKARAAARMAPSLSLRAYAVKFEFFPVDD
jgi:hypothetical protein